VLGEQHELPFGFVSRIKVPLEERERATVWCHGEQKML